MTDTPGTPAPGWTGAPAPRNGMGTAALVLGIVGLVLALFVIGLLPGLVAIVLGIIGVRRVQRGEANNQGMAIAGIVTGALAVLAAGFILAVVGTFWSENKDEINDLNDCLEQAESERARDDCQDRFREQLDQNSQ